MAGVQPATTGAPQQHLPDAQQIKRPRMAGWVQAGDDHIAAVHGLQLAIDENVIHASGVAHGLAGLCLAQVWPSNHPSATLFKTTLVAFYFVLVGSLHTHMVAFKIAQAAITMLRAVQT